MLRGRSRVLQDWLFSVPSPSPTNPTEALARELWDAYAVSMQSTVAIKASEWDELPPEVRAAWMHVARVAIAFRPKH